MAKEYVVLDHQGEPCGLLKMAICADYTALDKVMSFSRLEQAARWSKLTDPASFGFNFFEKQLARRDIYPVAALLDLEIDYKKRRRGYGATALRAFMAVAADQNARLGLLRIGTGGCEDDEYETAMLWRKAFYSKHGWVPFSSPPVPGLVLVWMYHLVPPLTAQERMLFKWLIEKKPEEDEFAPSEEDIAAPVPRGG